MFNDKAFPFYKAGPIQNHVFKVSASDKAILDRAQGTAEMKKTVVSNLRVSFDSGSSDIIYAGVDQVALVSILVTAHQPGKKRKSDTPTTLVCMKFFKAEYGRVKRVLLSSNYDPRPSPLIGTASRGVTALQNSLRLLGKPVALLHLHVPPSDDLQPTPTVLLPFLVPQIPQSALYKVVSSVEVQPKSLSLMSIHEHGFRFVSIITPSPVYRQRIEEETQKQSRCARLFEERYG